MFGDRRKTPRSVTREVVQIILSLLIVFLAGFDILGIPLRTVNILILVFGGMSAGVPLGRLIERRNSARPPDSESQEP